MFNFKDFIYGIIEKKKGMKMPRIKRNPKKVALAQAILETYNPESVEDMNMRLKIYLVLFLNRCFRER